MRLAVHHQLTADGAGIAAEMPLPIPVAQNRHVRAVDLVVLGAKDPPGGRPHAQDREHAVGDVQSIHPLRIALPGHVNGAVVPHGDLFEDPVFLAVSEMR